ncbi:MAG: M1 family peptidase, partial [Chitinophagaceae bacterium]|nr:M1 family peptidase [Chitinophagaceae bacterium]
MTKKVTLLAIFTLQFSLFTFGQSDRWQQRIKYMIDVKMDVAKNQFAGTEKLEYTNNSPDTLQKLFLHLYWNAFQPNSSMDVRSRELG